MFVCFPKQPSQNVEMCKEKSFIHLKLTWMKFHNTILWCRIVRRARCTFLWIARHTEICDMCALSRLSAWWGAIMSPACLSFDETMDRGQALESRPCNACITTMRGSLRSIWSLGVLPEGSGWDLRILSSAALRQLRCLLRKWAKMTKDTKGYNHKHLQIGTSPSDEFFLPKMSTGA